MTYAESVTYLYSLGNEIQTAKLGLERIERLLGALGNPHRQPRFVHVAGTNGKGSTSAMIESGLRAAGVRTGLYTSPHLSQPTERIRIEGQPVTEARFASAFEIVHDTAERMLRAGELDLHPTYFETVTAMAFVIFRDSAVDRVVLEVGLGGRLDATNVVTPELCVITAIDFDHQAFLGSTLTQIATEKAGILKPGAPAVFAPQHPEVAEVLKAHAQGPYCFASQWPVRNLEIGPQGGSFQLEGDAATIVCPLAGEHQIENARTAAIALRHLGYPSDGIALTRWPGRLEHLPGPPEIVLDGAHNLAGIKALAGYIRRFYRGRKVWLIYGVMRDKDVQQMAELLFPLAARIILTKPANSRAMPPEKIPAPGAIVTHSVAEALEAAREAAPGDAIFIAGSLFVVGEARQHLVE